MRRLWELQDQLIPPSTRRLIVALDASLRRRGGEHPPKVKKLIAVREKVLAIPDHVEFDRWLQQDARPSELRILFWATSMLIDYLTNLEDEDKYQSTIQAVERDPTPYGLAYAAAVVMNTD